MMDEQNRSSYQQAPQEVCPLVDMQRAVNEMALVNKTTGEVSYGIKSLFIIMGDAFPALRPLFSFAPFVWLMGKIYFFISFNRRVIVPPNNKENHFSIQPSFRLDYRIAYIIFTGFIAAFILSRYLILIFPSYSPYIAYLIIGAAIFIQALIAIIGAPKKTGNYLGNLATILFAGTLLLLPVMLAAHWVVFSSIFYKIYLLGVIILILAEYIRRIRIFTSAIQ